MSRDELRVLHLLAAGDIGLMARAAKVPHSTMWSRVRRAGVAAAWEPTPRQLEVASLVERLGSQKAAALHLDTTPQNIAEVMKGYRYRLGRSAP